MKPNMRAIAVAGAIMLASASVAFAGGNYGGSSITWKGGGFVSVSPKYEGSNEYKVVGAPFVFPSFSSAKNILDVRGIDDIRLKLLNNRWLVAGPLAGYQFGRDEDDGDRLIGLGEVDGGVVVGGFAGIKLMPSLIFGLSYHHTVSGDVDGGQLRFGLEYEQPLSNRVTFLGKAGATYADDDYMDAYFGVSNAQSNASAAGLGVFEASSGIKDVYVDAGVKYKMNERWSLKLNGRYSRLVGDAADSPVIEAEDQFSGSANITYKFSR